MERRLHERARPAVFDLLEREEALEHRLGRGHPADAQPGEELLRKRAEVEDVLSAVQRMQRREIAPFEAQVARPVVLDDDAAMTCRDRDDFPATRLAHDPRGRVVERGLHVRDARTVACQRELEQVGPYPLIVEGDAHDARAQGRQRADRPGVGRIFHDDRIARVDEGAKRQLQGLLGAVGDENR